MDNKIYIVAGARNMQLAQASGGGLWANVGQTTRQVSERLRDDDYKRKAAGGAWQVLFSQDVGDLSDKEIHPILKAHPRVHWEKSDNTEEFLFLDDPGDGSKAKEIVREILSSFSLIVDEQIYRQVPSIPFRHGIIGQIQTAALSILDSDEARASHRSIWNAAGRDSFDRDQILRSLIVLRDEGILEVDRTPSNNFQIFWRRGPKAKIQSRPSCISFDELDWLNSAYPSATVDAVKDSNIQNTVITHQPEVSLDDSYEAYKAREKLKDIITQIIFWLFVIFLIAVNAGYLD